MTTYRTSIELIIFGQVDSLDDMSLDQRRFLRLYAASRQDGVEDDLPDLSEDEMLELSDSIDGQTNCALRDEEGRIVAVASYDSRPTVSLSKASLSIHPNVGKAMQAPWPASYLIK